MAFAFAAFCDSMMASGMPTSCPRPTITTSACSIGIFDRTNISTIPSGVHGRRVASPRTILPTLTGESPSTSFSGDRASWTASTSMCSGNGSWTRMPWTSGSSFSRLTSATRSACEMSPGRSSRSEWMPTSAHALTFPAT